MINNVASALINGYNLTSEDTKHAEAEDQFFFVTCAGSVVKYDLCVSGLIKVPI